MAQQTDKLGLALAAGLVALVVGGSIAGLMLIGGPGEARAKKFDAAKMQLLINVETQLYCHYMAETSFPVDQAALAKLMEDGIDYDLPGMGVMIEQACDRDRNVSRYAANLPDEGFDYRLTDEGRPEVCVEFANAPSETDVRRPFRARTMFTKLSSLPSTPGRHCFIADANPLKPK